MKAEKDAALCRDFPLLYADRNLPMTHTCMCWGFECGDGWEHLIRGLSRKLEPLIAAYPEPRPRAVQVKQKYGTLCFYMSEATDEMHKLIEVAERQSAHICESCGDYGTMRDGGWLRVLCNLCDKT